MNSYFICLLIILTAVEAKPCERGYYLNETKLCDICPLGYYCSDGENKTACPAGRPGTGLGLKTPDCSGLCSKGYYCPEGSVSYREMPCPGGRFGSSVGLGSPDCSGKCTAGYYCPPGSVNSKEYECGPVKYYCPEGSSSAILAEEGYYTTTIETYEDDNLQDPKLDNLHSISLPCPQGYYCTNGEKFPCPPGTYGNTTSLKNEKCSGKCPIGYYCPIRTIQPIPCPSGTYTDREGLSECKEKCKGNQGTVPGSDSTQCGTCTGGTLDEEYNNRFTSIKCTDICGSSECTLIICPAGYVCPTSNPHDQIYECTEHTNYIDIKYCPENTNKSLIPDEGYYAMGGKTIYTHTDQSICEPGYFCIHGRRYPCPLGRYGNSSGLTDSNCTDICPKGYYCPYGTAIPLRCGESEYYCPESSGERIVIPEGNYGINIYNDDDDNNNDNNKGNEDNYIDIPTDLNYDIKECPLGYYCEKGVKRPCPPGYYGNTYNLTEKTCSGLCPLGHYCPLNTSDPIKCPSGTFSNILGSTTKECQGKCDGGYFCPEGSIISTQEPCAVNFTMKDKVYCPEGTNERKEVDVNHYGDGPDPYHRFKQVFCIDKQLEPCPSNTIRLEQK